VESGSREKLRKELDLKEDDLLIGNIGHLVEHKGHRYLIEAMSLVVKRIPQSFLFIAGDGVLREKLERLIAELGLRRRVFLGGVRDDIPDILQAIDLYVQSSIMEGLGTSILDAMAARKPVVATRAGGIPEMIRDGIDGRLVPPADPIALAEAIEELLLDPHKRIEFGSKGREKVERDFSHKRMVRDTLAVYQEIMS